jgi:hypothetical protein
MGGSSFWISGLALALEVVSALVGIVDSGSNYADSSRLGRMFLRFSSVSGDGSQSDVGGKLQQSDTTSRAATLSVSLGVVEIKDESVGSAGVDTWSVRTPGQRSSSVGENNVWYPANERVPSG